MNVIANKSGDLVIEAGKKLSNTYYIQRRTGRQYMECLFHQEWHTWNKRNKSNDRK